MASRSGTAYRARPIQKRRGPPAKRPQHSPIGLSANVRRAVGFMIEEGLTRKQAAERAGISDSALYKAFRNPEVMRHYMAEVAALRTAEQARNLHTAIGIRDSEEMAKTAAGNRVRLQAAAFLHGEAAQNQGPATAINLNIAPGYIIDCSAALAHGPYQDEVISSPAPTGGVQSSGYDD